MNKIYIFVLTNEHLKFMIVVQKVAIYMREKSDIELITSIQQGNESAFEELYRRYERKVYYTAYSMMRNEHDAKDAVQATFMQIHKSIHGLRKPDFFLLWMNRIVCGKCKDIFRKNKTVTIDIDEEQTKNYYVEEHIDFNPSKTMRYKSDKELMDQLIAELPYSQREVIVLFYFQNLQMQEIADVLHEPLGTIKSRLFLAKKNLRRHIEAYESREQAGLDFRALNIDALLLGYFTSEFAKVAGATASVAGITHLAKFKNLFATSVGKSIIVGAAVLSTGVVTLGVYHEIQSNNAPAAPAFYQNTEKVEVGKPNNAREAFYTLLYWAANEEQMKQRTADEANDIRNIYEYLKNDGGPYWGYLQERQWPSFFERNF